MCDSGKFFQKLEAITNYYGAKEDEDNGHIYHYEEEGEDIGNNQSGNINGFTYQKEYEGDSSGNLNNSGTLRGKNKNNRRLFLLQQYLKMFLFFDNYQVFCTSSFFYIIINKFY